MFDSDFAARAEPVPVADAALAASDPTRAFAVGDGECTVFAGVTRVEAREAIAELVKLDAEPIDLLAAVALPVVVSHGAGPHLVDSDGRLVLAVADHPHIAGARLAIGPLAAGHDQIGLVTATGEGSRLWRWEVRAEVLETDRVDALSALDAVSDRPALAGWLLGRNPVEG